MARHGALMRCPVCRADVLDRVRLPFPGPISTARCELWYEALFVDEIGWRRQKYSVAKQDQRATFCR